MPNVSLTIYKGDSALDENEYSCIYTDENGKFSVDLPEGVYSVGYRWGLSFVKNVFKVGTQNVTQDVKFDSLYKVSGTVKNQSGNKVKGKEIAFYCNGNHVTYANINEKDGIYQTYLPKGEYSLGFSSYTLPDTFTVSDKSVVYDVQLKDICEVTGKFYLHDDVTGYAEDIYFCKTDGSESRWVSYSEENYNIYLKANTSYTCYAYMCGERIELGKIQIGTKDLTKDLTAGVYEVSGVAKYIDGKKAKYEYIYLVDGDKQYCAYTAGNGNYSCYVPAGEYEIDFHNGFRTKLDKKIVVDSADATVHLQVPYYCISGKVKNQGEKLFSTSLYLYDKDGKTRKESCRIDHFGEYSMYLPAGEYTVAPKMCTKAKQSFVVGSQAQVIDL